VTPEELAKFVDVRDRTTLVRPVVPGPPRRTFRAPSVPGGVELVGLKLYGPAAARRRSRYRRRSARVGARITHVRWCRWGCSPHCRTPFPARCGKRRNSQNRHGTVVPQPRSSSFAVEPDRQMCSDSRCPDTGTLRPRMAARPTLPTPYPSGQVDGPFYADEMCAGHPAYGSTGRLTHGRV